MRMSIAYANNPPLPFWSNVTLCESLLLTCVGSTYKVQTSAQVEEHGFKHAEGTGKTDV